MILRKEKCQFSQKSVIFLGQLIDENGVQPDSRKVTAINKMPIPTNVAELRQFLGMINHPSKFAPNLTDHTKPLRDLLVRNSQGAAQQKSFENVAFSIRTSG